MKITFKVSVLCCGGETTMLTMALGSQAEQVRHRRRAIGNGTPTC
jgi:hypothetical protein